jgi:dTDP-4-amino-4,6-dideoxygalactose transaminase
MKVLFGDFKTHYQKYKAEIDQAIARVLNSGHFILGSELESFEKDFASLHGGGYTLGCASGTEAIYLALAACGVTNTDEVIVVAHTAVPTISAISMTGAKPVFVDIDPTTYLMDVSKVEALITPKTKAIIPVHLYGQMVDMQALLKIAAKHKIPVIEDVAQATGASYKGAIAGSLGEYSAFSFYPSKNIGAFGDAGAVFTKNKEQFEKLLMLRNYGQSKRYHHDIIGINSRLDEIQAAILQCRLPYLQEWNDRRKEIATRYNNGFSDLTGFMQIPIIHPNNKHVFHLYVVQIEEREALQNYLLDKGIQTLIHYPTPAHMQKAYAYLGYKNGSLPVTEYITKRILSLPMYPELTNEQIDLVIDVVHNFFNEHRTKLSVLIANDSAQAYSQTNNLTATH